MIGSAEIGETLMRAFILRQGLIEEGGKAAGSVQCSSTFPRLRSLAGSRAKLDCGGTVKGYRGSLKLEAWQVHSALAD
jgi:hypothetical protein